MPAGWRRRSGWLAPAGGCRLGGVGEVRRQSEGPRRRRAVAPAILSRQRAAAAGKLRPQAGPFTLWAAGPIGGQAAASVLTPQASCDPGRR